MHTRTWHLDVHLSESDDRTRAEAVLRTDVGTELRHVGVARRRPGDVDVPEIGAELATCRALAGVVHGLLDATIADVMANEPVRRPATATVVIDTDPEAAASAATDLVELS